MMAAMSIQTELLSEVEAHLKASGLSESAFGVEAVNDWKLVSRLRSGANMTLGTLNKVRDYLDAHPVQQAAE